MIPAAGRLCLKYYTFTNSSAPSAFAVGIRRGVEEKKRHEPRYRERLACVHPGQVPPQHVPPSAVFFPMSRSLSGICADLKYAVCDGCTNCFLPMSSPRNAANHDFRFGSVKCASMVWITHNGALWLPFMCVLASVRAGTRAGEGKPRTPMRAPPHPCSPLGF